jgi:DNA-binding beta-propeller fold protein YncE
LVLAALFLGACPASSDEVRPPKDQFFFPTGIAMTADENVLFVANANSDLRYDSGSISVVNLETVVAVVTDWVDNGTVPNDCEKDKTVATTLVCDEAFALLADSTVRTGNFATEIGVQLLDSGDSRIFAAVRGDPSLTWVDFDSETRATECGGGGGDLPRCDNDHRLNRMRNDSSLGGLAPEPFGLYVDSSAGFVVVTHLALGAVSLADAPSDGSAPQLSDALGGVFEPDFNTRVRSALGAAARLPGGRVYVTSRSEDRVQMFSVVRIGTQPPNLVPGNFFFLRGVEPSDNGRGIRFSADGQEAYIVNRSPPMLQILDTSIDPTGAPRNELTRAVELCPSASSIAVGDLGQGERVFIACFREGQVWAIDPASGTLDAIIDVGRGPQSLVVSTANQQLYVSNYLEDTIAVIDLNPASMTQNRVVLRLGRTRQSGGN